SDEANLSSDNSSPSQSPQVSWEPSKAKSHLTPGSPVKTGIPLGKLGSNKDLLPRRSPSFRLKQSSSTNLSAQRGEGQLDSCRNNNTMLGMNKARDPNAASNSTGDEQSVSAPPEKPSHTYYNIHPYPEGGEQKDLGLSTGTRQILGSTPNLCVERRHPDLSMSREVCESRRKTWEPASTETPNTFAMPTWHHTQDTESRKKKDKNVFKKLFTKK
ncbi:hypothetical protein scyTo_0020341, partial [Scyliorhinus torazame]|nr:hypothetical protein [Scyliorhinus torazame]